MLKVIESKTVDRDIALRIEGDVQPNSDVYNVVIASHEPRMLLTLECAGRAAAYRVFKTLDSMGVVHIRMSESC